MADDIADRMLFHIWGKDTNSDVTLALAAHGEIIRLRDEIATLERNIEPAGDIHNDHDFTAEGPDPITEGDK